MKSLVAILGVATLVSSVAAQEANPAAAQGAAPPAPQVPAKSAGVPAKDLNRIELEPVFQDDRNRTLDACHKADTSVGEEGFIWPCASQFKTESAQCAVPGAPTPEQLKGQQDCLCGGDSSFFADAQACSECKVQNGLQQTDTREFWHGVFQSLERDYCAEKQPAGPFGGYFQAAVDAAGPYPAGGLFKNEHVGVVVDPREYYKSAGFEVPARQGGNTAAGAAGAAAAVEDGTSGQVLEGSPAASVTVPAFIAVAVEDGEEDLAELPAETADSAATTPSRVPVTNGTAAAGTSLNSTSTASPAPVASDAVAAAGEGQRIIMVNGQRMCVYIVFLNVRCSPAAETLDGPVVDFQTAGIDETLPITMLESAEQFEEIQDTVRDAGSDVNCVEQLQERVNRPITAVPVGPVPAPAPVPASANLQQAPGAPQKISAASAGSSGSSNVPSSNVPSSNVPASNVPSSSSSSSPSAGGSQGAAPASGGDAVDANTNPACEASRTANADSVCARKEATESFCRAKGSDAEVQRCLCDERPNEGSNFFEDAVRCARRSPNCLNAEFQAQIFFETQLRFCAERQYGGNFTLALQTVTWEWTEARAPKPELS